MKKIFLILLLLLPSLAWGIGYSTIGDTSNITITRTAGAMDSAWAVFYLNTAAVDSFKAIPIAGSSHKTCYDSTIALTNAGTYRVRMYMFSGDALVDSLWDTWHNESASTPDDWTQNDSAVFYGLVWSAAGDTTKTIDSVGLDGINASSIAGNAIGKAEIADGSIDMDEIHAEVIDAIWNEDMSTHTTVSSFADSLRDIYKTINALNDISVNDIMRADTTGHSTDSSTFYAYLFSRLADIEEDSSGGGGSVSAETEAQIDSILIWADSIMTNLGPSTVPVHDKFGTMTGLGGDDIKTYFSTRIEQVKNAVWGQSADSAFAGGSMGDSAKYWGRSGSLSGSGANTVNVYIYDADTNGIFPNMVHLQTSGGGSDYYDETDSDGLSVFALANGTYLAWGSANGYSQTTVPDTVVVSSATTDTVYMAANTISAPNLPDRCTAYIYTYDITTDTTENAILEVTVANGPGPWIAADDSSAIMIPKKITATTDTSGKAEIVLWQSAEVVNADDITETIKYNFTLRKSNLFNWKATDRTVPSDSIWQIK